MSSPSRPQWAVWPLCVAACSVAPVWAQSVPVPAVLPSEAASSQADPANALPTVSVSARRDPDKSTLTQPDVRTARDRIQRTPGGAAVVDADDYAEGRVSTLSDALGMATGVFVQPRFGAEESRISIRGSGLQRTAHGRGLKLMQDGVPLNLADGSFDFQAVEALTARYVEVWRGANALQYGSSTLGGAVNFVSPNGYNADKARVRLEGGSHGYARALVSAGTVLGAVDLYVSSSLFQQDGFRDHARQDTRRNFANLGWQLGEKLETRFYLGSVSSDSELPGSLTKAQMQANPRQANAAAVSGDQHRDIDWTRLSNKTVYRPDAQQQLEFFVYASDKKLHHPIPFVLDQRNRDQGLELRYVNEAPLFDHANRFVVGLSASQGRTSEDRYANVGGASGARTDASTQTSRNTELYAENQWRVLPSLGLVAGLQAVQSSRKLVDRYVPAGQASNSFTLDYDGFSPKLGVLYDLRPGVQLFANLSRGYEPPTFSELAGGTYPLPNPAQRATTLELGSRGRLGPQLQWDVALYEARLENELLQTSLNGGGADTTVAVPHTVHRGLELGLAGQAARGAIGQVEWKLNALWNDFRFRDDPTYGRRQLPGIPSAFARAQLGYRFNRGQTLVALTAEHAGRYAVDFADTLHADAYTVWGLKASGDLREGLSWFVEGRNLGDKTYASATGVVRVATPASAQFLPGDGRAVYAGLDWRFN